MAVHLCNPKSKWVKASEGGSAILLKEPTGGEGWSMLILKQLVCRAEESYFHVPAQVNVNLVNSELLGISAFPDVRC